MFRFRKYCSSQSPALRAIHDINVKNYDSLRAIHDINFKNYDSLRVPFITVSSEAQYQSDVTLVRPTTSCDDERSSDNIKRNSKSKKKIKKNKVLYFLLIFISWLSFLIYQFYRLLETSYTCI